MNLESIFEINTNKTENGFPTDLINNEISVEITGIKGCLFFPLPIGYCIKRVGVKSDFFYFTAALTCSENRNDLKTPALLHHF
jgi:hypothetical protein